jgi:putative DNA primase/helicase
MSMSEQYVRRNLFEQNPALLRQIEQGIPTAADLGFDQGSTGTGRPTIPLPLTPTADDWPEPEPLGGELPAVQAFGSALLPESLRPLVEDTAERMQVPLDYPAVVTVLSLAGVTNRRATIQPKATDTSWTVVPNLWGGIIAPPGLMKSPVISAITRPLAQIEADWRAEYNSAASEYQKHQEEAELRRAAWREQFKAAQKSGKNAPVRPDDPLAEPVCRRLITQDATAEKLHEMLRDNPAGVLVIRDELSGWLATLDKPGREGERGFFLSAWNGDTPYTMDRIGRGNVHVEACCVSILGGIQPARLRSYLVDALQDGPQNDGLLQRFQVLVYPDIPQDWRYIDRPANEAAIKSAERVYCQLAQMDAVQSPCFRLAPEAQELFIAWLGELESKVRGDSLHPALVAHLAKYRSLMPSLALLFELADGGTETVSLRHAQQAASWCEYLESHARRVYSMLLSPERQAAAELGRHLAAGWKRSESMFTVRDVYQNDWRGLNTPDSVRQTLPLLEDAGWVRRVEIERAEGRPREMYAISPKLARRTK